MLSARRVDRATNRTSAQTAELATEDGKEVERAGWENLCNALCHLTRV